MSLVEIRARLSALERAHAADQDVGAGAATLLSELSGECGPAPEDAGELRRKAEAILEHLQLGPLRLPADCPASLAGLAARFEHRVIGPAFHRDLAAGWSEAVSTTRDIEERIRACEAEVLVRRGRVAALARLLEVLDRLVVI